MKKFKIIFYGKKKTLLYIKEVQSDLYGDAYMTASKEKFNNKLIKTHKINEISK